MSEQRDILLKSKVLWVKMPGFPFWPGRHCSAFEESSMLASKSTKVKQVAVVFLGLRREKAWILEASVAPFVPDSIDEKIVHKKLKNDKDYKAAVVEAVRISIGEGCAYPEAFLDILSMHAKDFPLECDNACAKCRGTELSGSLFQCEECFLVKMHWHCYRPSDPKPGFHGRWLCDGCCKKLGFKKGTLLPSIETDEDVDDDSSMNISVSNSKATPQKSSNNNNSKADKSKKLGSKSKPRHNDNSSIETGPNTKLTACGSDDEEQSNSVKSNGESDVDDDNMMSSDNHHRFKTLSTSSKSNKEEDETCFICQQEGKLLLCDFPECQQVYHQACVLRSFHHPLYESDDYLLSDLHDLWFCPKHHCIGCGSLEPTKLELTASDVPLSYIGVSSSSSKSGTHNVNIEKSNLSSSSSSSLWNITRKVLKSCHKCPFSICKDCEQTLSSSCCVSAECHGSGSVPLISSKQAKMGLQNTQICMNCNSKDPMLQLAKLLEKAWSRMVSSRLALPFFHPILPIINNGVSIDNTKSNTVATVINENVNTKSDNIPIIDKLLMNDTNSSSDQMLTADSVMSSAEILKSPSSIKKTARKKSKSNSKKRKASNKTKSPLKVKNGHNKNNGSHQGVIQPKKKRDSLFINDTDTSDDNNEDDEDDKDSLIMSESDTSSTSSLSKSNNSSPIKPNRKSASNSNTSSNISSNNDKENISSNQEETVQLSLTQASNNSDSLFNDHVSPFINKGNDRGGNIMAKNSNQSPEPVKAIKHDASGLVGALKAKDMLIQKKHANNELDLLSIIDKIRSLQYTSVQGYYHDLNIIRNNMLSRLSQLVPSLSVSSSEINSNNNNETRKDNTYYQVFTSAFDTIVDASYNFLKSKELALQLIEDDMKKLNSNSSNRNITQQQHVTRGKSLLHGELLLHDSYLSQVQSSEELMKKLFRIEGDYRIINGEFCYPTTSTTLTKSSSSSSNRKNTKSNIQQQNSTRSLLDDEIQIPARSLEQWIELLTNGIISVDYYGKHDEWSMSGVIHKHEEKHNRLSNMKANAKDMLDTIDSGDKFMTNDYEACSLMLDFRNSNQRETVSLFETVPNIMDSVYHLHHTSNNHNNVSSSNSNRTSNRNHISSTSDIDKQVHEYSYQPIQDESMIIIERLQELTKSAMSLEQRLKEEYITKQRNMLSTTSEVLNIGQISILKELKLANENLKWRLNQKDKILVSNKSTIEMLQHKLALQQKEMKELERSRDYYKREAEKVSKHHT